MDILIKHFQITLARCKKERDTDFISRIEKGWALFDKYYMKTDMSSLYAAALILHPARRTRYIEANWIKKYVKPTLASVIKLWEEYRETAPVPEPSLSYGRAICCKT